MDSRSSDTVNCYFKNKHIVALVRRKVINQSLECYQFLAAFGMRVELQVMLRHVLDSRDTARQVDINDGQNILATCVCRNPSSILYVRMIRPVTN